MKNIITHKIDNQTLVWFQSKNNYAVFNTITADILVALDNNKPIDNIVDDLISVLDFPKDEIRAFVSDIKEQVYIPNTQEDEEPTQKLALSSDKTYAVTYFYKINNLVFKADFETETEAFWIHPKFAHLETDATENFDFHYQVYNEEDLTVLFVNQEYIGGWKYENIHYFQGKFSMEIVQSIHNKSEDKWLGVFHASAVSDGNNSMLFLGDSGNGKSTSLALLQANGFTCIADDFVPVDAEKQEVYSFPSAISIKKNSVPVLIDLYPELETSAEYHLAFLNKVVRYLPPNNDDYTNHLPCKALVFIKYKAESELKINTISSINAFEKLVPDSWLSPEKENAKTFLDWFSKLPCYEIVYSNNEKMISTVRQLFKDEL